MISNCFPLEIFAVVNSCTFRTVETGAILLLKIRLGILTDCQNFVAKEILDVELVVCGNSGRILQCE